MRNLLLLCLLFQAAQVIGQDYVLTPRGDTIRGKITMSNYDVVDRIEVSNGKNFQKFTALQVKEVRLKSSIYHPIKTDHGYRMLKLVTPGYLSLYLAQQPRSVMYDVEWLVKKDGQSTEVANLTFRKSTAEFLADCPVVSQKILREELRHRDLTEIVNQYNACLSNLTAVVHQERSETPQPKEDAPISVELKAIQSRILEDTSLASRQDIADIITDIIQKVNDQKSIPRYQLDSFESSLKGTPYEADGAKLIARLRQ